MKIYILISLLIGMIIWTNKSKAQVSVVGHTGGATDYVGWDGAQAFPLQIRHNGGYPLNFYTDSTFRMTIKESTGRVGINITNPSHLLDVSGGDINAATGTTGYMIGGNYVLRHRGETRNIFVGVGAGANNTGGGAVSNTFVGFNAGNANISTGSNTFLGAGAGGTHNDGFSNTYIGTGTAPVITKGNGNVCLGAASGIENDKQNAIAIGAQARAMNSHQMILGGMPPKPFPGGRFATYVGIGYSFDPAGPQRILDVRDSLNPYNPQFRITYSRNKWTDFRTTGLGDLCINPSSEGVDRRVGINDTTPGNTLEITSTPGLSPQPAGLRFTHLTSSSGAGNSNGKVLTVNDSGDVVLVIDSIGSGGGSGLNSCGSGSAMNNYVAKFIPNDTTLCQSIIYDDGTNVGVGTTSPAQKLDVNGNVKVRDVAGVSRGAYYINTNMVLHTEGNNNVFLGIDAGPQTFAGPYPTAATFIGYKTGTLATGQWNTFVGDRAGELNTGGNGNTLIGSNAGNGLVSASFNTMVGLNAGVYCTGSSNVLLGKYAGTNITGDNNVVVGTETAVYTTSGHSNTFIGNNAAGNNTIGHHLTTLGFAANMRDSLTYATAIGASAYVNSDNTIAIGRSTGGQDKVLMGYPSAPSDTIGGALLYVNKVSGGTFSSYFNGHVYSTGNFVTSDSKLKSNMQDITDANAILDRITPKSYHFDRAKYPSLNLPEGLHYGVSADEMESIIPSAVTTVVSPPEVDTAGNIITPSVSFKAVNYQELIVLLMASNKQLRAELSELKAMVTNCCTPGGQPNQRRMDTDDKTGYTIPVDLRNAILLEQNSPNPFAERTTINFNLTPDIQSAQIVFYDNLGRILKSVPIAERGAGTLDVYAGNLSSGLYTYSLLADGKVVDSKKMVCNK